jgi:hypothetical protein
VLIPLQPLLGGHNIVIRPSPYARAATFGLADLPAALHAASAASCGPDFPADAPG